MKISSLNFIFAGFCLLNTSIATADLICGKIVNNKGKNVIQSKTVQTPKCPSGFTLIASSATFTGPQGPQGIQGSQGIQGPQGAQGASGPKGVGIDGTLPSGSSIFGLVAHVDRGESLNRPISNYESFGLRIPTDLTNDRVVIKGNEVLVTACGGNDFCLNSNDRSNQDKCNGTSDLPTATPGYVCIYPTIVQGTKNNLQGSSLLGSKYGFQVTWVSDGLTLFSGHWVYTAP